MWLINLIDLATVLKLVLIFRKVFLEGQKQQQKALKIELEALPKGQRKEVSKKRKEELEAKQKDEVDLLFPWYYLENTLTKRPNMYCRVHTMNFINFLNQNWNVAASTLFAHCLNVVQINVAVMNFVFLIARQRMFGSEINLILFRSLYHNAVII